MQRLPTAHWVEILMKKRRKKNRITSVKSRIVNYNIQITAVVIVRTSTKNCTQFVVWFDDSIIRLWYKNRVRCERASSNSSPKDTFNKYGYLWTDNKRRRGREKKPHTRARAYILLFSFRGINLINEIREYLRTRRTAVILHPRYVKLLRACATYLLNIKPSLNILPFRYFPLSHDDINIFSENEIVTARRLQSVAQDATTMWSCGVLRCVPKCSYEPWTPVEFDRYAWIRRLFTIVY